MTDAFIYDAVRTPRGKGKASGSLHEVTPVRLASHVLEQLRDRNDLDTSHVDDVVLGCVEPVGEQGADIARTAVLQAGYDESVSGIQQSDLQQFMGRHYVGGNVVIELKASNKPGVLKTGNEFTYVV